MTKRPTLKQRSDNAPKQQSFVNKLGDFTCKTIGTLHSVDGEITCIDWFF